MKEKLVALVEQLGLLQLLEGADTLSEDELSVFCAQLNKYAPSVLAKQREILQNGTHKRAAAPWEEVHGRGSLDDRQRGETLLAEGKAACLLLAGGQGSRLNQGPKAFIPVSPIKAKPLLQLFCERVRAASLRYGHPLPLCIMTSPLNHKEIEAFLHTHNWFGLEPSQVVLFAQEMLPCLDHNGNWLLERPGVLAEGPAGNGEALHHLHTLQLLDKWHHAGVEYLNTVFIDNPLADPFDAELIGLAQRAEAEAVVKGVLRSSAAEQMGVLATTQEGSLEILEYSELTQDPALFPYLNTGMFCVSVPWLHQLYSTRDVSLPWHIAQKTLGDVPIYKYETFLFDILTYATRTTALIYPREEVYAPLKNATGEKSLETVRQALLHFDRQVLGQLTGQPLSFDIELDPQFYYPDAALKTKWWGRSLTEGGYVLS